MYVVKGPKRAGFLFIFLLGALKLQNQACHNFYLGSLDL